MGFIGADPIMAEISLDTDEDALCRFQHGTEHTLTALSVHF
jgi:hypothetical protein